MNIGYLGPKGTFSYEACKKYCDEKYQMIEYKTISSVIEGLEKAEVDQAIVPIENLLQGGVTETIDTLIKYEGIYVTREITLKINQNLMSNKKYELNKIKEVYSHPQALAQCKNYIENNLKNAIINEASSTALAAKEIKNKEYCACIANKSCAKEYDLVLLDENIQDNNLNETKFWILNKVKNKNGNKVSIIFSTQNKPGELYKVLGIFDQYNINLSKIESRPAKTVLGEYIFLVDIDVNKNIEEVLEIVKNNCSYFRILGIY